MKTIKFILALGLILTPLAPLSGFAQSGPNCSSKSKPTLNSCTSNRYVGNEPRFYSVKDDRQDVRGGYENRLDVEDGQVLFMRITAHNNARSRTANSVRVRVSMPSGQVKSYTSRAVISSSNAGSVSDTIELVNNRPFKLTYVAGSTRIYGVNQSMQTAPDGITGGGVGIGNLPAGENRMTYVTFQVKVEEISNTRPVSAPVTTAPVKTQPKAESRPTQTYATSTTKTVPAPKTKTVVKTEEESQVKTLPPDSTSSVITVPAETPASSMKTVNASTTQTIQADTPNTIKTLPDTGAGLLGVVGSATIGCGALALRRSRRQLRRAALNSSLDQQS